VGTGLVGRAAISVPEGTYKILLHVPDAPMTIPDVHIAKDKTTTVELGKKQDKLVTRVSGPS